MIFRAVLVWFLLLSVGFAEEWLRAVPRITAGKRGGSGVLVHPVQKGCGAGGCMGGDAGCPNCNTGSTIDPRRPITGRLWSGEIDVRLTKFGSDLKGLRSALMDIEQRLNEESEVPDVPRLGYEEVRLIIREEISNLPTQEIPEPPAIEYDRIQEMIDTSISNIPSSPAWEEHLVLVADREASYWGHMSGLVETAGERYTSFVVTDPPEWNYEGVLPALVGYRDGTPIEVWDGVREVESALLLLGRGEFTF
jgi:hypothetical protein